MHIAWIIALQLITFLSPILPYSWHKCGHIKTFESKSQFCQTRPNKPVLEENHNHRWRCAQEGGCSISWCYSRWGCRFAIQTPQYEGLPICSAHQHCAKGFNARKLVASPFLLPENFHSHRSDGCFDGNHPTSQ